MLNENLLFIRELYDRLSAGREASRPRNELSIFLFFISFFLYQSRRFDYLNDPLHKGGHGILSVGNERLFIGLVDISRAVDDELGSELLFSKAFKECLNYLFWNDPGFVRDLLEGLSEFMRIASEAEIAEAFESSVLESFLPKDFSASESYTTVEAADLVVNLAGLGARDSICDITCGGGRLLSYAAWYLRKRGLKCNSMKGIDVDIKKIRIAKIAAVLCGFSFIKYEVADSLAVAQAKKYDVVLSHPPFSLANWRNEASCHKLFEFGGPPKNNADFAFIQVLLSSMQTGGRALILVPEGVLFRGGEEGIIREKILGKRLLHSVISLPIGFLANTSIKPSILIFKNMCCESVLFIDAAGGRGPFKGLKNVKDISSYIIEIYEGKKDLESVSRFVSYDEIEANSCHLGMSRYFDPDLKGGRALKESLERQKELELKFGNLSEEFYSLLEKE